MRRILVGGLLLVLLAAPAWGQGAGWEKQWSDLLAAAQKEGTVVVAGIPDPVVRRELPAAFKARFGIAVEYIGGRSSEAAAKLRSERQAGVYTVDVFLSGIQTMATILYREKMLDPVKPALFLPEVVDPAKWKRGKLWFMDPEEQYVLRLFNYVTGMFFINTRYAKPDEFTSVKDLLHPKWKGKISVFDPTVPGTGSNDAAALYLRFGEEFAKKLYIDQKPAITRDSRQLSDWLARGTYPISLNVGSDQAKRLQEEGFPVMTISGLPDAPGVLTAGFGQVALVNKAPHPNAARLFVNWIASKEGLEIYSRALYHPTTRNDIDESFAPPEEIPRPGVNYFDSFGWEFTVTEKEKVRLRMKELLSSR